MKQKQEREAATERALRDLYAVRRAPSGFLSRVLGHLGSGEAALGTESLADRISIRATRRGIAGLALASGRGQQAGRDPVSPLAARGAREVREYLCGRRAFFTVPPDLSALAPFARRVLEATARIPYGEVRTYRWVAERLGAPAAVRAVGNALARNPVPILIPCHRVIRSDGAVGGYALGAGRKRALLELEAHTPPLVGCATTRVICRRGCAYEQRIREENRIHMASLPAARELGYRPCTACRPR